MKKSRLLVLPLILALAACNKTTEYNVRAELPSGGEEVKSDAPEQQGYMTSFMGAIGAGFNSDRVAINFKANANLSGAKVAEGVEGSGSLNTDVTISAALPTQTREFSSLKIEANGLTFNLRNIPGGMDEEGKPVYKNFSASGLKFSVNYQVNKAQDATSAYVYLDLSNKNLHDFLKSMYDEYVAAAKKANADTLKLAIVGEEPTFEFPDFDTLFGKGKFALNLTSVMAAIEELMAEEADPTYRLPAEEGEETANPDILAAYLPMGFSALQSYLPMGVMYLFQAIYGSGENAPTVKVYKDAQGAVSRIGVADVINYDDIKNAGKTPTVRATEQETEPKEDPVQKINAGYAIVVGNTHGTSELALESVEARADVVVKDIVNAQATAALDFKYGEQAAFDVLTAAQTADYADLTVMITAALPKILPMISSIMGGMVARG